MNNIKRCGNWEGVFRGKPIHTAAMQYSSSCCSSIIRQQINLMC